MTTSTVSRPDADGLTHGQKNDGALGLMSGRILETAVLSDGSHAVVAQSAPAHDGTSVRRLYLVEPPSAQMLVQTEALVSRAGHVLTERLLFGCHRVMLASFLVRAHRLRGRSADPEPSRILCLGLGGGALPTWLVGTFPRAEVHVYEKYAGLVPLARAHFAMPAPREAPGPGLHVHIGDALELLRRPPPHAGAPFDVILVDLSAPPADARLAAPPSELLGDEACALLRRRARDVVALNVLFADCLAEPARRELRGALCDALARTFASVHWLGPAHEAGAAGGVEHAQLAGAMCGADGEENAVVCCACGEDEPEDGDACPAGSGVLMGLGDGGDGTGEAAGSCGAAGALAQAFGHRQGIAGAGLSAGTRECSAECGGSAAGEECQAGNDIGIRPQPQMHAVVTNLTAAANADEDATKQTTTVTTTTTQSLHQNRNRVQAVAAQLMASSAVRLMADAK